MSKVEEIVAIVEQESPGLLDSISQEDGITREGLVRKVLAISHCQMVNTHQNKDNIPNHPCSREDRHDEP